MASEGSPRRPYRSTVREGQARTTRLRILRAARESFTTVGYAATTIRAVAATAGVSRAMVELAFGTKAALLKTTIDVAIAGDDEPVPMLDRDWAQAAANASGVAEFLAIVTGVIGPSQERSAGPILAAFEGSGLDDELADLVSRLVAAREGTAGWIVDRIVERRVLRAGLTRQDAVDTVWLLMDPAVFTRLTRHRGWSTQRYQQWLARSLASLLLPDPTRPPMTPTTDD